MADIDPTAKVKVLNGIFSFSHNSNLLREHKKTGAELFSNLYVRSAFQGHSMNIKEIINYLENDEYLSAYDERTEEIELIEDVNLDNEEVASQIDENGIVHLEFRNDDW